MRVRARPAGRRLVPPGRYIGHGHSGVPGQRAHRTAVRGRTDLGQHPDQVGRDASQGSRPGQQLPATGPIHAHHRHRMRRGRRPARRRPRPRSRAGSAAPRTARQSRASASWLSGIPARARRIPHSWARRRGIAPFLSSAQALHRRAASVTASGQSGTPAGGQFEPAGGDRAKRYASERCEDHLGQREQVGRPFEQLVADRGARYRLPYRRQRRLLTGVVPAGIGGGDDGGAGGARTAGMVAPLRRAAVRSEPGSRPAGMTLALEPVPAPRAGARWPHRRGLRRSGRGRARRSGPGPGRRARRSRP